MGYRRISLIFGVLAFGAAVGALGQSSTGDRPAQDPKILRFVSRAVPWYPDSIFSVISDERFQTPSGSYRIIGVDRQCDSRSLSGEVGVVVDEVANTAWMGSIARLPFRESGIEPSALGRFLEDFLPEWMRNNMRYNAKVDWSSRPSRSGALIPFNLVINTGYGEFRKAAAVSSQGEHVVIWGTPFPMDEDPVAYRKDMLAASDLVTWDHGGDGKAALEIVEFSDYECPGCRATWPLIKSAIEANGPSTKHGMVSFPLTSIHPWAFRSASASWCIAAQNADSLVSFKELFYSMQPEMEVSLVTPTSLDFLAGHGLDEDEFRSCYLREPSIEAVHGQMALGHRVGVNSTPTYFVNGWKVQRPSNGWFPEMVERLLAGEDLS
jgi:hypothetical protein